MAVIEQIDVRIAFKIVEALSVFRKNFHCAETAFSVAGLMGLFAGSVCSLRMMPMGR